MREDCDARQMSRCSTAWTNPWRLNKWTNLNTAITKINPKRFENVKFQSFHHLGRLKKIYIQANNSNHYYLRSHQWRILQIHWIFLKMTWNNHQDITCWEKWHMLWNVQELIINFDWFWPRKIHRFINEVIHVVQYKFNARSNNYY